MRMEGLSGVAGQELGLSGERGEGGWSTPDTEACCVCVSAGNH